MDGTLEYPAEFPGDDEQRWQAVLDRDTRFDGVFVTGVRSTGIFCRPSCPARKPLRKNVVFFPVPEAAVAAGYRPCKRCRPESGESADPGIALVRRVLPLLTGETEGLPTLDNLGRQAGISPHHLQRTFKRVMGLSPRNYGEALRLARLKVELKRGESVASALYGAGYGSPSRLYESAARHLGMTPASYARGGRGVHLMYTIADCPLGRLLVAATEKGVAAVSLGGDDAVLTATLEGDYPAAEIHRDDEALAGPVAAILKNLSGRLPHLDLPLDVRATAFQWQVWQRLKAIPAGETRTYGEIARELGKPGAARAVGRACASNRVALVVPCHRAVGADGALTGYRWGVARKKRLLEREKKGG